MTSNRTTTWRARRRAALDDARHGVEASWERCFRDGRLIDLRSSLNSLPLLVQCAVRVHDRREGRGALVLGLGKRFVVVAVVQRLVLIFSSGGVLDAAGTLFDTPDAPLAHGERWTRIEWDPRPAERAWY